MPGLLYLLVVVILSEVNASIICGTLPVSSSPYGPVDPGSQTFDA